MAKKSKNQKPEMFSVKYDSEALAAIALKVKSEGFVPQTAMLEQFGPEKTTQGIAVLFRDFRMFREVRRPWGQSGEEVLGYEWTNRPIPAALKKKVPPQLGFIIDLGNSFAPKYTDYQRVSVRCRFLLDTLGGHPVEQKDKSTLNSFERAANGCLVIQRFNLRAMIGAALPVIGKEHSLARRITFATIYFQANGNLTVKPTPVIVNGEGKGIRLSECLAAGTEFTITANIPTSALSIAEFLELLRVAGETVGLSPGRSAGFGDFEVLSAE